MDAELDLGQAALSFGAYHGFADGYAETSMYFDNLQIYGEALTAVQISNLYQKLK